MTTNVFVLKLLVLDTICCNDIAYTLNNPAAVKLSRHTGNLWAAAKTTASGRKISTMERAKDHPPQPGAPAVPIPAPTPNPSALLCLSLLPCRPSTFFSTLEVSLFTVASSPLSLKQKKK